MLVLTRKTNEKIVIDVPGHAPIEIMITEVRRDRVRVGCKATPEIGIWRSEVYEQRRQKHADQQPWRPEYFAGVDNGFIRWTLELKDAARFESAEAALSVWSQDTEAFEVAGGWSLRMISPERRAA